MAQTMFKNIVIVLSVLIIALYNFTPSIIEAEDENSPIISNLQVLPDSGPVETGYTISLRIVDPQGPEDIKNILYQVREKSEVIELTINDNGAKGDLLKGDGIYTGKSFVPKTAARQAHFFEVFTVDKEGHKSNVLRYRFTVLENAKII